MRRLIACVFFTLLSAVAAAETDLIAPPGAKAGASLNMTPAADDLTMSMLRTMLGAWNGGDGSALAPVVGDAMRLFNSGMLVLGSILFMYTAVVGTLHSAHDGEILGKKWSTVWVPARIATGVTMLFPTASGFSIGQIFVLWIAAQGIGLANLVWQNAADSFLNAQGAIVAVRMKEGDQVLPAMKQLLKAEVCLATLQRDFPEAEDLGITNSTDFSSAGSSASDRQGRGNLTAFTDGYLSWGGRKSSLSFGAINVSKNECGTLQLPSRNRWDQLAGDLSEAESSLIQAQTSGVLRAAETLRGAARTIVAVQNMESNENINDVIKTALSDATNTYIDTVSGQTQRVADQAYGYLVNVIKNDAKNDGSGWLGAGSWYYQLARTNSAIGKSVSWMPMVEGIPVLTDFSGLSTQIESAINGVEIPGSSLRKAQVAGQKSGAFGTTVAGLPGAFKTGALTDSVISTGMSKLGFDPTNQAHPIIQMKNVGDTLLASVETAAAAVGAARVLIELIPGATAIKTVTGAISKVKSTALSAKSAELLSGGPLSAASTLACGALFALLAAGVVLSLYLPMMPFLVWFGGLVGYFITVFATVVAVPVWMAAHLHPEGEGMSSVFSKRGYGLLAEVFARPVLMVFGLIGALVVLPPLLSILFGLFQNAIGSMQADSVSGAITWVVLVLLYVATCVKVVHKIFTLIHVVPDTVPRWFGSDGGGEK